MITPAYTLTATERVLPRLALDFTTGTLDPRVTIARALNTATRVNSSGYVEIINADLPRFDYDPITLAPKGLLIEESRTNLTPVSSNFASISWERSGTATVATDQVNSPDNTQNADLFRCGATAASEVRRTGLSFAAGAHTFSVFAKKEASNFVVLQFFDVTTSSLQRVWFDLNAGTVGTSTSGGTNISLSSTKIEPYANGFYRCVISVTLTLLTTTGRNGIFVSNANGLLNGNASSGIYLYGAQLEAGAKETSYIPTQTTAVTRNADVATMTGTNFSSWYDSTEGGAVVQVLPSTISGTRPAVEFHDNTAIESITLRGVAADPQLFVVDGGATQATLDAGTITANTLYKLGGAWKASSFVVAINGAAAVTQASGTFPTATQARLGSDGTNYLNGHLQSLRFWPQRLTNAEVQAFSK